MDLGGCCGWVSDGDLDVIVELFVYAAIEEVLFGGGARATGTIHSFAAVWCVRGTCTSSCMGGVALG